MEKPYNKVEDVTYEMITIHPYFKSISKEELNNIIGHMDYDGFNKLDGKWSDDKARILFEKFKQEKEAKSMKNNKIFAIQVGDNLTLHYNGKHYNLTSEMIDIDRVFDLVQEIKNCNTCEIPELIKELDELLDPLSRVTLNGNVNRDNNGNVYLGKSREPVPGLLGETILKYIDKKLPIENLVNFWNLCQLNPSKTAVEGFFKYVQDFGIVITDNGYVILYKAVTKTSEYQDDKGLVEFVGENYLKVKNKWKKSPDDYFVWKLSKGGFIVAQVETSTTDDEYIGNLFDLYNDIENLGKEHSTYFTDKHTRKMRIQLGAPVSINREECDPDITRDCSFGIHVGSFEYVSAFGNSSDTILACLVNPANIVALPQYDHSKIRCCSYFPYAIMEKDENGNWEEIEGETFEDDYAEYEVEELKEMLATLDTSYEVGEDVKELRTKIVSKLEEIN